MRWQQPENRPLERGLGLCGCRWLGTGLGPRCREVEQHLERLLGFQEPARDQALHCGIGPHVGTIGIEFVAPDESCLDTELHNLFKKPLKDGESIARTNLAQTAVIGDGFIEVIAEVPAMREIEAHGLHQLSFRADAFEEHDQLQLEKRRWGQ